MCYCILYIIGCELLAIYIYIYCISTFYLFHCSDSSGKSIENTEVELYNDDALTPVYEWKNVAYSFKELIRILLTEHSKEHLCVAPPINVPQMKKLDDLKCDDMGAWIHTGSPKLSAKLT